MPGAVCGGDFDRGDTGVGRERVGSREPRCCAGATDQSHRCHGSDAVDLTTVGEAGLVAGCRTNRTDGANRKWASRFANGLRRSLLNDDCPDTACGLKLIPRDVFLVLPFFDALHRYLPALTGHLGFRTICVDVENRPRAAGASKYTNLGRAAAGLFDLLGVIWLMRRTHTPGRELLLGARGDRA